VTLAFILAISSVQQEDPSAALARTLRKLRDRAGRSVVAIEVDRESDPEGQTARGSRAEHEDYYNRPKGPCSGVILEAEGFIATSYFNVSGGLKKNGIRVTLWDGRTCPAELLGFDEQRDIALLKVAETGLPVLPKADLAALGQGAFVAVLGRSPDRETPTVNLGILSAMNRMRNASVQTDAEMNYGNAGGALVTLRGELVGVGCNVKPKNVWGQSGGIGFACKVTEIEKVLPRLKNREKIEAEKLPFLGITPGEGDPNVEGVHLSGVVPGSPAEKAGLKKDDVVVEFDGKKVTDFESLRNLILAKKPGDEATLKARRPKDEKKSAYEDKEFKAKLEARAEP
jgi:S1-C subfamily serine protease